MGSEHPDVAVVVPARNAAATLAGAVASVLGQRDVGELEVVIAVGPSSDETMVVACACAEDERVRVVVNDTGTTPAGLNLAIKATTAPVVVRVDAHAQLPAGYISSAVRILQSTGAGNVGGRQVPVARGGFGAAVAAAMSSPAGSGGAGYRSGRTPGPTDTVYLGVFRRSALEEVGGFDERLLRNQDYELNYRLRAAGHQVWFDPALAVSYIPRDSVRSLARQYLDYGRWKRVVLRAHPRSVRPRQLGPPVLVAAMLAGLILVPWAWWPAALVMGVYAGLLLTAGIVADARRPLSVATALAVMHVAWGAGFLMGTRRRPLKPS